MNKLFISFYNALFRLCYNYTVYVIVFSFLFVISPLKSFGQDNNDLKFDLGLFNTDCSTFEIRIKPNQNIESTITNIQFTLKWPENSFDITSINSDYGLAMQGSVIVSGGFKYAVFATVPADGISKTLESGIEYKVLSFNHNQTGPGNIDVTLSTDAWTEQHNGMPYIEALGLDHTGIIYHDETGTTLCPRIDLGLFNMDCSTFEVRIKPNQNIETTLTNIQFTLKWPENSFDIMSINSDYGLAMQGSVIVSDGFKYAVFATVPADGISKTMESGIEYTVMTFNHNQTGPGNIDVTISNDNWTNQHNGLAYIEMLGLDKTGIIYHNETGTTLCPRIDIGLFNTDCSVFEVRIKPNQTIESTLTNIQFTLKWPENSFDITSITSDYGLSMQGSVIVSGGFKYAVFVTVPAEGISKNLESGVEYPILTFKSNQQGNGNVDITITKDNWTKQYNGMPYIELLGLDNTGIVYHNALNANAGCPIQVFLKVILQGAYDGGTGEMRTSLNLAGVIPNNQPYCVSPWLYSGLENVSTFTGDIVDWVLLELRDKNDPAVIIGRRSCLLSKNGDIFDLDNTTGVAFELPADNYYLVVRHRNHLPVISASPVSLPNELNIYNFTDKVNLQQLELNPPLGSGKYGMIAGNVIADNMLKYLGSNNDKYLILKKIQAITGQDNLNTIITNGYYNEDTSLDNKVIYIGPSNDKGIILLNLIKLTGSDNLNSVYSSAVQ